MAQSEFRLLAMLDGYLRLLVRVCFLTGLWGREGTKIFDIDFNGSEMHGGARRIDFYFQEEGRCKT